jgi:hypothetical protein
MNDKDQHIKQQEEEGMQLTPTVSLDSISISDGYCHFYLMQALLGIFLTTKRINTITD